MEETTYKPVKRTSLGTYLKDISRIRLLTREEEISLARRIRRWEDLKKEYERKAKGTGEEPMAADVARALRMKRSEVLSLKADADDALQHMVEANLRFVVTIANRYRACGIALLDLINEGNIGLIEAARRFDPDRGVKFISYAVWWIRQAIMQALAEQCGSVRLPLKQAGLLYKIREKYEEMSKEFGKEPATADLAKALNLRVAEVEEIMRVSRKALSLESPIGEDSDTAYLDLMTADNIPPVDHEMIKDSLSNEVEKLLKDLSGREERVIRMRFGIGDEGPLTLEKVGEKLGLSRERIRQIEKKAKKKLLKKAKGRLLADYLH